MVSLLPVYIVTWRRSYHWVITCNNYITTIIDGISSGVLAKSHFPTGLHQWKLPYVFFHMALAIQGAEKPQMASILGTNLIQPLESKWRSLGAGDAVSGFIIWLVTHPMANLIGEYHIYFSTSPGNGPFSVAMLNRGHLSVALLWGAKCRAAFCPRNRVRNEVFAYSPGMRRYVSFLLTPEKARWMSCDVT